MKHLTPRRILMLLILTVLVGFKTVSCDSGGSGCDAGADLAGCLGCEGGGIESLALGEYPLEEKINNLAQVRVTESGFRFVEQNAVPIIETAMGGSLSFEIPEDGAMGCSYCTGGCNIELNIAQVVVNPIEPDVLQVKVYLAADTEILIPLRCGFVNCDTTIDTNNTPLELTANVNMHIDGATRQLDLSIDEGYSLSDINIDPGGICGAIPLLGSLINMLKDSILPGIIKPIIGAELEKMIESFKCIGCADSPCADPLYMGVYCDDQNICRKPNNDCQLLPLGLEAEVDIGTLAADLLPGLESKIWLSLVAGGRAQIEEGGLELGMFGGTMVPPGSPDPCTQPVAYPVVGNLAPIPMTNHNTHLSPPQPYHIGIGLREELLDQAGFTVQNSGLLCLTIDSSFPSVGEFISLGTFAFLLPSMNKLTQEEETEWAIMLTPGEQPIDFQILDGPTAFPDSPDMDIALGVKIRDLSLNFYGLIDERFVRLFVIQIDVDVLAGLDVMDFAIQPVFGLDNVVISNYRIPYSVLAKAPEDIAGLIETLIGGMLGQIPLEPFDPIEIPGIDLDSDDVFDLFIQLQMAAPEMAKSSGTPTEYSALAIYANLLSASRDGMRPAPRFRAGTTAKVVDGWVPSGDEFRQGERPWVKLELGGKDADGRTDNLEYQIRLDNSGWTPWSDDASPLIDARFLAFEGKHKIYVRARDAREPFSYDRDPAMVTFTTDYQPPSLRLMRQGSDLHFKGRDNVTSKKDLMYRHRIDGGEWGDWSLDSVLDLGQIALPATIEAEVMDEYGLSTITKRSYEHLSIQNISAKRKATGSSASADSEVESAAGCRQGDSSSAMWLLLLLPLALLRRSRKALLPISTVLLLTATMIFAGCDSGSSAACSKNADCGAGQMCQNGACVDAPDGDLDPCETDDDCEICHSCLDGVCVPDDSCDEPDGDTDGDKEQEAQENDKEDDDPDAPISCEDGECPECYYCAKLSKECEIQRCDPTCPDEKKQELGIIPCVEQKDDTCAICIVSETGGANSCDIPRCTDAAMPDICACREAECDEQGLFVICRADTSGECVCATTPCGDCPDATRCCPSDKDCMPCPAWCEGMTCEPGYAPGGCNPTTDADCEVYVGDQPWDACVNFDEESCTYSGLGRVGDPSCNCEPLPPLDLGFTGRYNDVAVRDQDIWISAYNTTYGDLVVAHASTTDLFEYRILLENSDWLFLDGVPEADPTAGPNGPREGISEEGDNVGKYTSVAIAAGGLPRIAYQDVDNGDLLFMYAEAAEVPADGDEAGRDDAEQQYEWTRIVVDAAGDTGYYTTMYLDSQDRPVIAYTMINGDEGSEDFGMSKLKLAMATSPTPASADDFVFVTVDTASVGEPYCATPEEGCTPLKGVNFGTGINPSLTIVPSGELWVHYYHNTSYQAIEEGTDNIKVGNLMRARLGNLPDPATLESATFDRQVFLGSGGQLAELEGHDVGQFHSFDVIETNGWYVMAFSDNNTNTLQFVYDFGDGLILKTADDGKRRSRQGDRYSVWVGASCTVAIDGSGYIRILYQDQSQGMLMYYSEQCYLDSCNDLTLEPVIEKNLDTDPATGHAESYGVSTGYFTGQQLVGGMTTILGTYVVKMVGSDSLLELQVHAVPKADW